MQHDPFRELVDAATGMSRAKRISYRSAVRRLLGTSDTRHDAERVAAAEAKRARRRERAGGSSS